MKFYRFTSIELVPCCEHTWQLIDRVIAVERAGLFFVLWSSLIP